MDVTQEEILYFDVGELRFRVTKKQGGGGGVLQSRRSLPMAILSTAKLY